MRKSCIGGKYMIRRYRRGATSTPYLVLVAGRRPRTVTAAASANFSTGFSATKASISDLGFELSVYCS
jgi:hypothetical protein